MQPIRELWYQLGRGIVWLYARLLLRLEIRSERPLPKGAKILALNHPSTTDPILATLLTGERVSVLITEVLFRVPVVGQSLRFTRHIEVVYGNGQKALDEAAARLKAGGTVMIFPEGVVSPAEGGFNKVHSGVGRLALATGAPVIPVGVHLDHKRVVPIDSTVKGVKETGRWYWQGPYTMTVGRPVVYGGDAADRDYVQFVSRDIMRRIIFLARKSALCMEPEGVPVPPALRTARIPGMPDLAWE